MYLLSSAPTTMAIRYDGMGTCRFWEDGGGGEGKKKNPDTNYWISWKTHLAALTAFSKVISILELIDLSQFSL